MEKNTSMHIREYGGLLAAPEKKALLWLAQKTPRCIHSDHLTLLGLVAMLLAGASYWAASYNKYALILVVVSLAANWFGDSLDGTLARVPQLSEAAVWLLCRSCHRPDRHGRTVGRACRFRLYEPLRLP